jgi:putative flippase GtrA
MRPAAFFDAAFRRYALTSAAATLSDFTVASSLHRVGSKAWVATALGCLVGGGVAFALGRNWTFRAASSRPLPQLLRFGGVWASSALLNSCGVAAGVPLLGSFSAAWLAVRASVYLGWNYPLSRWFVFPASKAVLESPAGH